MARAEYTLLPNECFILSNQYVHHNNTSGKLILTNLNLVYITSKGTFKIESITQKYPLSQIKVFNEKAQAVLGKNGRLDVYFINGVRSFVFRNNNTFFSDIKAEKEAERWIDAINQLLTGEQVKINASANMMNIGTEMIAEVLGDTVDTFKSAFGFKPNRSLSESVEKITKKCSFCGAAILGKKGQVTSCSYCDTDQQL